MSCRFVFNYSNVMDSSIGNNGISEKDIDNLKVNIEAAINNILEKSENEEIGFINILDDNLSKYDEIKEQSKNFKNIVVIGMGGSILGTQTVYEGIRGVYYNEMGDKRVYFLDNSDPEKTYDILKLINLEDTLLFAVSKSGNTSETIANFLIFEKEYKKLENYKKNIIIISNGGVLKELGEVGGYKIYSTPDNIGGRFSVLSSVGLAPLSALNINIKKLINGAKLMRKWSFNNEVYKNPPLLNGVIHYLMMKNGKSISVLMPYIERLHKFGMWYRQLWAESLGKNEKGQTPVVSLGAKDQHSQLQLYLDGPKDKIITFLRVNNFKNDILIEDAPVNYLNNHKLSELILHEQEGTESSLTENGVPNISLSLRELDEYTLGMIIFMYEMQTAFTGELLGVNAYDQPAVERGKIITKKLMTLNNLKKEEKYCENENKYCIKID